MAPGLLSSPSSWWTLFSWYQKWLAVRQFGLALVGIWCGGPGGCGIVHDGMDCSCVDSSQDVCVSSPGCVHQFLIDLAATASRCVFHVRWVSSLTPRKVGFSTCGTGMFSSFSITFSFTVESEKSVAYVLLQLISLHHSFAQELTLLMVSCMTCAAVEVCSAEVHAARWIACREFVTLGGRVLTLSFTYRRNRVGERTLPCGTPSLSLITLLGLRFLWTDSF